MSRRSVIRSLATLVNPGAEPLRQGDIDNYIQEKKVPRPSMKMELNLVKLKYLDRLLIYYLLYVLYN